MYDTRTEKAILSVNHGSPIESLLFLPSGGVFLSAGGTDIKIWDTVAGGKLIGSVVKHHKTVTCLRLGSDNKRLLSGSLDRHVKIYDVGTYNVVFDLEYPNAVLSLGVSKNDDVVAGLVDGLVSVRRITDESKPEKTKKSVSYKFSSHADEIISEQKTDRQTKHDCCLRKFQYAKALDVVLFPYIINKTPEVTVSVIHELMRRKALHRAFQGRETKSILQILRFFNKYITDTRFTKILIDAINVFVDVYGDSVASLPSEVGVLLLSLNKTLGQEVKLLDELGTLMGSMQLLLAGASAGVEAAGVVRKEASLALTPSKQAQENLVVNLT